MKVAPFRNCFFINDRKRFPHSQGLAYCSYLTSEPFGRHAGRLSVCEKNLEILVGMKESEVGHCIGSARPTTMPGRHILKLHPCKITTARLHCERGVIPPILHSFPVKFSMDRFRPLQVEPFAGMLRVFSLNRRTKPFQPPKSRFPSTMKLLSARFLEYG
jgi:hypothetical protein